MNEQSAVGDGWCWCHQLSCKLVHISGQLVTLPCCRRLQEHCAWVSCFASFVQGPEEIGGRRVHPAQLAHAARIARAQQQGLTLYGFKVFPDLTPGRAFMWGTILAVYAVGTASYVTARSCGVTSVRIPQMPGSSCLLCLLYICVYYPVSECVPYACVVSALCCAHLAVRLMSDHNLCPHSHAVLAGGRPPREDAGGVRALQGEPAAARRHRQVRLRGEGAARRVWRALRARRERRAHAEHQARGAGAEDVDRGTL